MRDPGPALTPHVKKVGFWIVLAIKLDSKSAKNLTYLCTIANSLQANDKLLTETQQQCNVLWSKQHGVGTGASTIVEAVQVDPLTGTADLGGGTYPGEASLRDPDANVLRKVMGTATFP